MKKILILYAAYGGGHLSAAKSIKQYIDDNYNDVQTQIVDCMKYINKTLDKVTTDAYKQMAKKAPWAWKKIYYGSQKGLLGKISTSSNNLMARKIYKLFKEFEPDIVISTHPFSSQMASYLKEKGKINPILVTVMTDFAPHNQWLIGNNYVDLYFVSNNKMKETMIAKYGIEESKVYVTGIPISNRFLQKYSREETFQLFNLDSTKKTIILFGGGEFGLGKEKNIQILDCLAKSKQNIQVVAISGRNEKMRAKFEEIVSKYNKQDSIKVLSFTDKVPELMSISDLVITKPGGLTTSESLVSRLPIIVINPIPGQEEENAEFLESSGCAIWIKKEDNPEEILNLVLEDNSKLEQMKEKSFILSKKNSTADICNITLNYERRK